MIPKVRLLTAAAVTLLLAALVLVGGVEQSQAGTGVEIEFWHAMSRSRGEVLEGLVGRFNRENPGITVKARFVGAANPRLGNDYSALYGKLLEHLARGTPPDVAQVYENWTTQLIEINALTPVDQFLAGPGGLDARELDDFVTVFREANAFPAGGSSRLYTLPFNKSIFVLYYNRALFNELGLKPPETWEDFRAAARTISERKGIPGLVFQPSVDMFGHYLYAHGGHYIQDNRASFGGETGVGDLDFWSQMVHSDRSARPAFDAMEQFEKGQSGMYIETTSRISSFEKAQGLDFGVTLLPRGTTRAYQFAGTNLALFSASSPEKQKAAWQFIRFLTSSEITAEWALGTGYLPVRKSAISSPRYQQFIQAHPEYAVGLQALQYAVVQPRVSAWESIRGILDDAMFEALSRKNTSGDALQRAVSLSNNLLSYLQGRN